jgi:hypothetical protein
MANRIKICEPNIKTENNIEKKLELPESKFGKDVVIEKEIVLKY